jgi:hypothetical protein
MATRKKKPWNSGLDMFGTGKGPEAPAPPGPMGLSTGQFMQPPERWRVVELVGEGAEQKRRVHMQGEQPWVGSESRARTEASLLQRAHGGVWVAEREDVVR